MTYFDTTTPQLKVVDRLFAAYRSCDPQNLAPSLSKNYKFQSHPKTSDLHDQTGEEHIESLRLKFAKLTKIDVYIRHW